MAKVHFEGVSAFYYDTSAFTVNFPPNGGVFTPMAGDPAAPTNGQVWYDSGTGKFRCREAGASVDLRGSGSSGKDFTLAASQAADFTATSWNEYPIGAANVDATTPAAPTTGDKFALIFLATRANCTLIPNTGFTVMGSGSALPLTAPGSGRKGLIVWMLIGTDWVPYIVTTWG